MQNDQKPGRDDVKYAKGFPSFAAFVASDKSKSTHIYHRFERLGARNLLYLQDELAELEAEQDAFDREDLPRSREEKKSVRNFGVLKSRAAEDGNAAEKKRLELVEKIRGKVKEHREAMFFEHAMLSFQSPSAQLHKAFWHKFHNYDSEHGPFETLGGHSARIYEDLRDLVSLHRQPEEDRLTAFLREYFSVLFIKSQGEQTDSPLAYTSERRLQLTVTIINTVMAAVLLFGAILNLYAVGDQKKRLGLVAGYTVLFAICVGLATNARRSEVFAACAAYSAVLVVFISGGVPCND